LVNLNDMPDDEPMQAGIGTGERLGRGLRWRVPCVGVLSYEWLNGMGVVICDNALPSTA